MKLFVEGLLTCRHGYFRCGDTPSVGGALPGKRVPCVPQTSDGREGWLLLGVSRLFPEDWDAVFGTLCVLLWLLYLVVL